MNFGQALSHLIEHAGVSVRPHWRIRRSLWKDGVALGVDKPIGLVWLEVVDGVLNVEPVTTLAVGDIMASDWEVVA